MNASTSTPTSAAPMMISVGDNCPYSIFGAPIWGMRSAAVVHRLWTAGVLT